MCSNHLAWVRRIYVKGQDRTEELLAKGWGKPANIPELAWNSDFQRALAMKANSYLDYFYLQMMMALLQAQPKTRAEVVMEIETALWNSIRTLEHAQQA